MALATLQRREDIAHLTLARPAKRNALSKPLIQDLRNALTEAKNADARVLLLKGEGPTFCAGGDLEWMKQRLGNPEATREALANHLGPLIRDVATFPAPTIAAVQGAAIGAGLGLALACDLTLVAEDATLGATHASLGLTPDGGTSWFLTQLLGPKKALDLILSAETLTGNEAETLGLATESHPPSRLEAKAREHAHALSQGPTKALAKARELVYNATDTSLADALANEADAQADMYATEDQQEGVQAFLDKREPRFQGQ